jgi:hypothetical protein
MPRVDCEFYKFLLFGDYSCKVTQKTIANGQIEFVGSHLFESTNCDVRYLAFEGCTFSSFPINIHECFPNLTSLRISDCKLKNIKRKHLKHMVHLKWLRITNCGLTKLDGHLLSDLKRLENVSFKCNHLSEIGPEIFDGLSCLNRVNFKGNDRINAFYEESLEGSLAEVKSDIRENCKPDERIFGVKKPKWRCLTKGSDSDSDLEPNYVEYDVAEYVKRYEARQSNTQK